MELLVLRPCKWLINSSTIKANCGFSYALESISVVRSHHPNLFYILICKDINVVTKFLSGYPFYWVIFWRGYCEVDNDLFLVHADSHTCTHSLVAFSVGPSVWPFNLPLFLTGQQVKRLLLLFQLSNLWIHLSLLSGLQLEHICTTSYLSLLGS